MPSAEQIVEKQLFSLIDKIEKTEVEESQVENFMPIIFSKLGYLSKEDLIRKVVAFEFERFSSYYENAPDLNVEDKGEVSEGSRKKGPRTSYSRFIINAGSNNKLKAGSLIGLINEQTENRDIKIGRIQIKKKFSIFEVPSEFEKEVMDAFENAKFNGHSVFLQLTAPDRGFKKRGGKFGGRGKSFGGKSYGKGGGGKGFGKRFTSGKGSAGKKKHRKG